MEELLGFVLEIVGEFLLEVIVSLILRALGAVFEEPDDVGPLLPALGYMLLGVIVGGFSLWLFPHPMFHPTRYRGISLLISPLATGSIMALLGFTLRRNYVQTTRIESFTCGFAFAFGLMIVRLFFVR